MAQKDEDKKARRKASDVPNIVIDGDEFDNAVTTEISQVLSRAFDGTRSEGADDVKVTDLQLSAHIEPSNDDALESGFLLNKRFEIVELVHSGGMAHVYKAIDRRRHSEGSGEVHVAIKMMRSSVASEDRARFTLEREAAKAQTLSHPNIINIFDFDEHDEGFFLVMEWLEGESVNSLLRRTSGRGVSSRFAWSVIEGTAAAVRHAHQNDVVHADINPSNIFITESQDIKLLDFGVARYTHDSNELADDGFAWVTQTYASPEVLSGLAPVFEDDIFSLGCVAYRLLSGKHPFGGSPSLVAKHKGVKVEPIPGLADEDWQVLSKALAYSRSERPTSVSVFIDRALSALGPETPATSGKRRMRPALQLGLAAAVVVAAVAGTWWLAQRVADPEVASAVDPSDATAPALDSPAAQPVPSAADAVVAAALQALSEGKLISPEGDNARTLLQAALAIEPDNAAALRGMRDLSDEFVQIADAALDAGDPAGAYDALATAAEIDAGNPAIEIVNQLLAVKGESELADARLAVAAGSLAAASLGLSRAEQYRNIDREAVRSVRQQIAQSQQDNEFLARLDTVNAHIDAGRLSAPVDDNAHALLVELAVTHGADPRLQASTERLGERLLTQAAFATAAAEFAEATELLDAVDTLGVLSTEAASARASLQGAIDVSVEEEAPQALPLEQTGVDAPGWVGAAESGEALSANTVDNEAIPETLAIAAPDPSPEVASSPEPAPAPSTAPALADPSVEPQQLNVATFGIEKYVAPVFPRRARWRGIDGSVVLGFDINADGSTGAIAVLDSEPGSVFDASAIDAVSQWRFAPREDVVRVRITLNFNLAD